MGGVVAAGGLQGCGLIDLDSFRAIDIQLPKKSYTLDPAAQGLDDLPVGQVPAVGCTPATVRDTCCKPPGVTKEFDCDDLDLVCDAGACKLNLDFVFAQSVNLQMEVPQLSSVGGAALQSITLKTINYEVNNGLNVNLPPIDLYIAAAGVTSVAAGSGAEFVVQIPPQPPGFMGTERIAVPAAGQAAFSRFATNFRTPFVMLTSIRSQLKPGDIIPQGRADIEIGGIAEVSV